MNNSPALSGILVIDKPLRLTSMDVVDIVRRKAGRAKTGHAGTLDPLATGVLVIAVGPATKLINLLMDTTKRYSTVIDLSAFTTTDDLEGTRTDVAVTSRPTESAVRSALVQFTGSIQQKPPAFSAMKIDGTRAYKLARQGKPVDIPYRTVVIHSITLSRYEWPLAELEIHCDKGVYVRSLARDLGCALQTGGHCAVIRRTAVGPFSIEQSRSLDDLPNPLTQSDLIAPDEAVAMLKKK